MFHHHQWKYQWVCPSLCVFLLLISLFPNPLDSSLYWLWANWKFSSAVNLPKIGVGSGYVSSYLTQFHRCDIKVAYYIGYLYSSRRVSHLYYRSGMRVNWTIYIYIGMIMVALTLLGFHGDFLVATTWWIFWCVNWPWYTTRVFWWFFRGNNPWHLDIEMIMVALRLHGLEAGTEPERSGSGAGTKRIRWFQRFFTVFHGFLACRFAPASLPLHSRFLFLVFF